MDVTDDGAVALQPLHDSAGRRAIDRGKERDRRGGKVKVPVKNEGGSKENDLLTT